MDLSGGMKRPISRELDEISTRSPSAYKNKMSTCWASRISCVWDTMN